MQSKMTEKEFREKIALGMGCGLKAYDVAAQVAREAGLEFTSEPVGLPPRLAIWRESKVSLHSPAIAPERGGLFVSLAQRDAAYAAMVERYNAHPGLRVAAEALVGEMVRLWPEPSTYGSRLIGLLRAAQAELAKGPKP